MKKSDKGLVGKEEFNIILRLLLSVFFLGAAAIVNAYFKPAEWVRFFIYLVPYLISGYDIFTEMIEKMKEGEFFSEELLMAAATLGAMLMFLIPSAKGHFQEACLVVMLFKVGELFEHLAQERTKRSVESLAAQADDTMLCRREDKELEIAVSDAKKGDIMIIKPGDRICCDGVIVKGESELSLAALTGESMPVAAFKGDNVYSGSINLIGALEVRITKEYGESTARRIRDLALSAGEKKAKSEKFITVFSRYYTPAVLILAFLIAFLPIVFGGEPAEYLYRALIFLVISCPCALVISVPLTYFAGIGGASKKGVIVKGGSFFDSLAAAKRVIFDKTGTLTKGVFRVKEAEPYGCSREELLHIAAHAESKSTHPIARAVIEAYDKKCTCTVSDIKEMPGLGVCAIADGKRIMAGNGKLLLKFGIPFKESGKKGSLYICRENECLGYIVIEDDIRPECRDAVSKLKNMGIEVSLYSGDTEENCKETGRMAGIRDIKSSLMPQDKLSLCEAAIEREKPGKVVFAGDGINDAPVIMRADVGIAMGSLGSDAAIEASDVIIMDDDLNKVPEIIKSAVKIRRIATENIIFAIGIKIAVLILSAFGSIPMLLAVFADVGVTVLAVLNSLRAFR